MSGISHRQHRIIAIGADVFDAASITNQRERALRFAEEAIELARAAGLNKSDVQIMLEHEYNKPDPGHFPQEVGGTMVTLYSLTGAHGYDAETCADVEINRVRDNKDKIRAKAAKKPDHLFHVRPLKDDAA
jgi:hypothetical protein